MTTDTVFTTSDGQRHDTLDRAFRHAEARYANALAGVAHRIVSLDWKYSKLVEFLDENLVDLMRLKLLKDDARTWVDEDGQTRTWVEGENGRGGDWKRANKE